MKFHYQFLRIFYKYGEISPILTVQFVLNYLGSTLYSWPSFHTCLSGLKHSIFPGYHK